jgi:predicted HD phosphohydrolase
MRREYPQTYPQSWLWRSDTLKWQAEKVTRAEMILQCSQCERVGANERAVGCAGCLRVQLPAN